jgi:hypothetical protein
MKSRRLLIPIKMSWEKYDFNDQKFLLCFSNIHNFTQDYSSQCFHYIAELNFKFSNNHIDIDAEVLSIERDWIGYYYHAEFNINSYRDIKLEKI